MIDICINVIERNINNLLNITNNSLVIEKVPNSKYFRITDQIIKIMKEKNVPLIHLNCSSELNCK